MSGSKNLILGFCSRQSLDRLAPFIASLRLAAFAGDVCLLVEDVAAATIGRLRALGIIVERAAPSAQPGMTAMSSRHFSYLDFMTRRGEGYGNVLLVDPSTTLIQADPFGMQLPAEIVYAGTGRLIGETPDVHGAVVRGYGEAVAHNIRDCTVANAATTLGTRAGMLRYLAAMTQQLAGRSGPITGALDKGVHNYIVHMRPLPGAWLDRTGGTVVALDASAPDTVAATDQGVLTDGRLAPVVADWDAITRVLVHVRTSPRYRLDDAAQPARRQAPAPRDAVAAFYYRPRDAGWLELFLGSLRCVNDAADVYCIGDFDPDELAVVARFGALAFTLPACEPTMAENLAHFYLHQVLEGIVSAGATPDQLLLLDGVRAVFPRDPFLNKTVGLSLFREGPARIGELEYNRHRLALFMPLDERALRQPVVSSMVLRGPLPALREFYRRMFIELVGRAELLKIHKVVQGIVNKLCHTDDLGFPVTVHPNGAEVYFEFLGSSLALDTRRGVRIGGTVPGVVLGGHPESPLLMKLRIDLNLADS